MKQFEMTALTKLFLSALGLAVACIRMKEKMLASQHTQQSKEMEDMIQHILENKLDVRLVPRDY